jgi:hypothetical protein
MNYPSPHLHNRPTERIGKWKFAADPSERISSKPHARPAIQSSVKLYLRLPCTSAKRPVCGTNCEDHVSLMLTRISAADTADIVRRLRAMDGVIQIAEGG